MSFYGELAQTADELLREFGAPASLARVTPGVYDPATGGTSPTLAVQAVTAAVFDYDRKAIDGTLVLQGDKQVYMSTLGVTPPQAGDVLTWQTVAYTVISVMPLAPAGTDVLHTLQVRR